MPHHYILGLGSNIEPAANTVAMIRALLTLSDQVVISRVVETAPVDIYGDACFYNLCACLTSDLDQAAIAGRLHQIEQMLGRDRNDPDRKRKSRPADLDILIAQPAGQTVVSLAGVPDEAYLRPMLLELIYALDLSCAEPLPPLPAGVPLLLEGVAIGEQALRITRAADGTLQRQTLPL